MNQPGGSGPKPQPDPVQGTHSASTLRRHTLVTLIAFVFVLQSRSAAQTKVSEYQVKAAYLLNFSKLVQWPQQNLPDGPTPFVIGVVGGGDDFIDVLKEIIAGQRVETHPIVVKHLGADNLSSCHLVFFRSSERRNTQSAIASLDHANVLLIGEDENFLRQGGMIKLLLEDGRIRFEVNHENLERTNIHFSAKLLALAKANHSGSESESGGRHVQVQVPPDYPQIAHRMKLTGTVQLQAVVRADGTVKDVKVIGGHPLLADALTQAVRKWKYEPASKESVELVKFNFGP
jgi:TonB family protein